MCLDFTGDDLHFQQVNHKQNITKKGHSSLNVTFDLFHSGGNPIFYECVVIINKTITCCMGLQLRHTGW